MKAWICLLLGFTSFLATGVSRAQPGPTVPCTGCSALEHFSVPSTGFWYNPERSGSGLVLQVQDDVLFGALYAYNADGSAQWYVFNGRMESAQAQTRTLRVVAPLERFTGGMCLNCPYTAPTLSRDGGSITLEFNQRNYGSYTINAGERQFIVPLVAGIAAPKDFAPLLDYGFPTLTGPWSFVLENPAVPGNYGGFSMLIYFGEKLIQKDATGQTVMLSYLGSVYAGTSDQTLPASLTCIADRNGPSSYALPVCELSLSATYPGLGNRRLDFPMPYANLGAGRIEAVHPETGVTLKAFRVDFD